MPPANPGSDSNGTGSACPRTGSPALTSPVPSPQHSLWFSAVRFSYRKAFSGRRVRALCRGPAVEKVSFSFETKAGVAQRHPGSEQGSRPQVAQAYSKTWSFREDALLTLYQQLVDTPVGTPKEDLKGLLRAAVFLVRRSIRDIVTPVSPPALRASVCRDAGRAQEGEQTGSPRHGQLPPQGQHRGARSVRAPGTCPSVRSFALV